VKKIIILVINLSLLILTSCVSEAKVKKTSDGFNQAEKDGITFNWKIEGENINIKLKAEATGWVAIGFDPSFMMKDANIIIGYVKDGKTTIEDHFAFTKTKHKKDIELGGKYNISNKSGIEKDGFTEISFTIPLNSGDEKDTVLKQGKMHKVIFAYSDKDDLTSYHKKRTGMKVKL